jgi:tRNA(Ile)-lysidine synthetase-like protein
MTVAYSKPSDIGGTLIRRVIALFKEREFPLPLVKPLVISVSGGVDSMVLAHLIASYGRKIIDREQITLLHLDHGWRKESAHEERMLVERLAKNLGVKFIHRKLPEPSERASQNLEEDGRLKRQAVYQEMSGFPKLQSLVMTAHHENDAVESMFWRFLRGEFYEYREGILFYDSGCVRPFLKVTKEEILSYARAEKVDFLEDRTNRDPRFFRAWMRMEVFPLLEKSFPNLQKTLSRYLTKLETAPIDTREERSAGLQAAVEIVTGTSLNRSQRKALHEMVVGLKPGASLSLPGGRQIRRTEEGFLIR